MLTVPARVPALDAAFATVRERGLRLSSARRLVLAALCAAGRPLTADDVAAGAGGQVPECDIGSVYRNLETLEAAGVVRGLHAAAGPRLWTLAHADDEAFVMCQNCGNVRSAPPMAVARVRLAVRAALGYRASFSSFPIVGVCARCEEHPE